MTEADDIGIPGAMNESGESLIARVAESGDTSAALALLNRLYAGYPVDRLRLLLRSNNVEAAKAGSWIASELGVKAAPLLGDVAHLLTHPSRYVRVFALDTILAAATTEHGRIIAAAVERIEDADEAVRWKAMNFLARATKEQIVAGLQHLHQQALSEPLEWLVEVEESASTPEVVARLTHEVPLHRRFAAAAAARLAPRNPAALRSASESIDTEVQSFAGEIIDAMG